MARLYIDIRDRSQSGKVIKTYIFRGDASLIVTNMKRIEVIEHEKKSKSKSTYIDLEDSHAFSVRNWGN